MTDDLVFEPKFVEIPAPSGASDGDTLVFHRWSRKGQDASVNKGTDTKEHVVILLCHGVSAHGRYPTVLYQAEEIHHALRDSPFEIVVLSSDLPGHGVAKGTSGLLRSVDAVTMDITRAAEFVTQDLYPNVSRFFLGGTSMGAAIALNVVLAAGSAQESGFPGQKYKKPLEVTGLILVAPLIGVHDDDIPGNFTLNLLQGVSWLVPSLPAITPKASNPALQYKDPKRRAECVNDPLQYNGKMRLGTANTLLKMTLENQRRMFAEDSSFTTPFLILRAEDEKIVDPTKADLMMKETKAVKTKKLVVIKEALHGIFCEPEESRRKAGAAIADFVRSFMQKA